MCTILRALSLLLCFAYLSMGAAVAQTKLRLGYTAANDLLPAFVAKDHGFFAKNGLDVEPGHLQLPQEFP